MNPYANESSSRISVKKDVPKKEEEPGIPNPFFEGKRLDMT